MVVGNAGRSSPARCLAMRSANGERRWASLALIGFLQVAAPDVAPVDQAQRDDLVGRQAVEDARILFRRSHQVDVQAVHREVGGQAQVVFQAAEVGGDQLLQRFAL